MKTMNHSLSPRRREGLVIVRLKDESLVYDVTSEKAHALNSGAAFVFDQCDGTISQPEIVDRLMLERSVSISAARALMEVALEQLSHRGLLEMGVERAQGEERVSRRRILRQLATAAVAIPAIVSLGAPAPAAASSSFACLPQGACTTHASLCCSGRAVPVPSGPCIAQGMICTS